MLTNFNDSRKFHGVLISYNKVYVGLLGSYIGYQFQISFVLHHVVSRYCYPFRKVGNLVFFE